MTFHRNAFGCRRHNRQLLWRRLRRTDSFYLRRFWNPILTGTLSLSLGAVLTYQHGTASAPQDMNFSSRNHHGANAAHNDSCSTNNTIRRSRYHVFSAAKTFAAVRIRNVLRTPHNEMGIRQKSIHACKYTHACGETRPPGAHLSLILHIPHGVSVDLSTSYLGLWSNRGTTK